MKIAIIGSPAGVGILSKHIDKPDIVAMNDLDTLDHDILISLAAPYIPKRLLDTIKCPAVNLHTAPLPNYRGRATDSWMILNGDAGKTHGCAHYITPEIDAGDIIATEYYSIPRKAYPIDIYNARQKSVPKLLQRLFENISNPEFTATVQDERFSQYWPELDTERDGKIDWNWSAEYIERHIRAFGNPYPGAWTRYNDKTIRILSGSVVDGASPRPGLIIGYNGSCRGDPDLSSGARVGCGEGVYCITEVTWAKDRHIILCPRDVFKLGRKL